MSGNTKDGETPQRRVTSPWQIVEHVPLPPGRALPAPGPSDTLDLDDDDAPQAPTSPNGASATAYAPPSRDADRSSNSLSASEATIWTPGVQAPRSRPLFADLDQFLAQLDDESAMAPPARAQLDKAVAAATRAARRRTRRAIWTRLVVLALIIAILVVALVVVGASLFHTNVVLPAF